MVLASELRSHMIVRMDDQVWRVVEVKAHAGGAQTKGTVHVLFLNVRTRNESERRFRPGDRVENAEIEIRNLDYSYRSGDSYVFLDPRTFDPVPVSSEFLGPLVPFLTDGLPVQIEFLEGDPVGCRFPPSVEMRVASTGPCLHQAGANVWKDAFLENGMSVKVPLFIETGETVRIDVATQKYVERVHG